MFYPPSDVRTRSHVGERRYITFDYGSESRFIWSKVLTKEPTAFYSLWLVPTKGAYEP